MSSKLTADDLAKLYIAVDKMPERYLDALMLRCEMRKDLLTKRREAKLDKAEKAS